MRERLKRLPTWIDKLWPWGPIVLVALAVLTGIRSIADQPPESDTDQIADVVRGFGEDADNQRGEEACAWLTPSAQQQLVAEVPTVTCAVFVRSFGLGFDPHAVADAHIKGITVSGEVGVIRRDELLTLRDGQEVPIGIALQFAKTADGWKISAIQR